MNMQEIGLPGKIGFALIFGAVFGLLLTFTPLALVFKPVDCWDSQDDFLYSWNQIGLIFSAVLAFFVQSMLKIRGWKGFFKTIAATYLCFQVFSLIAAYDVIYTQHCYYPLKLTAILKSYWGKTLFMWFVGAAFATIVCLPVLSVYKRILARIPAEKEDFLKLDLNAK